MYKRFFKRTLDLFLSTIGFIVLLPLSFVIFLVLYISNEGKPIFLQPRPGKNEKIFYIFKFKTMNDKKDLQGKLLPDEKRITKFGAFLRKTSLDEIPQLLNIIKGEMSLIGPRPLRVRYLPYYTKEEQLRHSIRPGITGLAQISGRNLLNWDDRLQKDVEYVKNISFALDFKILVQTFLKVIAAKDIALDSDSGMIDFDVLRKASIQNKDN
ncbi:Sugar transferase involved in LPS biosynthesis (colanic, teichoic acid) [Arenibacter nanhaiticus]|uniref:Sugar transferase involved in LPS biosynthesis (Colanic, teichoic acid) n=1 Tax=Arenibacter nanhaiticus TaxID=558155 RepID=A0A1M6KLQ9_9FLAO|nr:sugar transferase [Arenibacter nanhaiticus]SHJ59850.1 Sugar transferase involved in LPS biosynthesis (colanic, teichoic acid) [Arenibacter nanhaiticus]